MIDLQDDTEYIDSSDNGDTEPINRHLSTERFIDAIKSQPAIWDPTSGYYSHRLQKAKSWEKVCAIIIPTYSSMISYEKNKAVLKLQRRWKSLRSCYCRERKKRRNLKNSTDLALHKEYLYFSQMSFLNGIDKGYKFDRPRVTPQITKKTVPIVTMVVPQQEDVTCQQSDEDDAKETANDHDLIFLHSLLPHIKKVPDECKLDFQSEILESLKKYVNNNWAQSTNRNPQYEHYAPNSSKITETNLEYHFGE